MAGNHSPRELDLEAIKDEARQVLAAAQKLWDRVGDDDLVQPEEREGRE